MPARQTYAAIAQGIGQGLEKMTANMYNIKQAQELTKMKKEEHDYKMKKAKMEIDYSKKLRGEYDPAVLNMENQFKLEKNAQSSALKLQEATLNNEARKTGNAMSVLGQRYNQAVQGYVAESYTIPGETDKITGFSTPSVTYKRVDQGDEQKKLLDMSTKLMQNFQLQQETGSVPAGMSMQDFFSQTPQGQQAIQQVQQESSTQTQQGSIPQQESTQQQAPTQEGANFVPTTTETNISGVQIGTKYKNIMATQLEDMAKARTSQSAKTIEAASTQMKNFNKSLSLFSNMVSQLKAKEREQGGLGLVAGIKGDIASKLKVPGYGATSAFEGQRKETALALNNVITGQNRVIKSVVDMINTTLPTEYDTGDFAASKIAQSVTNAFKLKRAVDNSVLTPSDLAGMSFEQLSSFAFSTKLTPEEEAEKEMYINDILSSPAEPARHLIDSNDIMVKSPQGEIGMIPKAQLDAAKKQGYMEV